MPQKPNKIAVKWLESKDAGKTHRVNVKHIVGKREDIQEGAEIVLKLNMQRYRGKVVDLLDFVPPMNPLLRKKLRPSKENKKIRQKRKQTEVCLVFILPKT